MWRPEASLIQNDVDGDERCAARCSSEYPVVTRVWATGRCLVAPWTEAREPSFAAARSAAAATGWPVVQRRSGGLTVPNGQGVINVTIARLAERVPGIAAPYLQLCRLITDVLDRHGVSARIGPVAGAFCDGRYNVAVGSRKLAGTAQRWTRQAGGMGTVLIAHALILLDLELDSAVAAVNRYYADLGRPFEFAASSCVTLAALGIDGARFEEDLRYGAANMGAAFVEDSTPSLRHSSLETT